MVKRIPIEQRLAELEGTVRFLKSEMEDQLYNAYQQAVLDQDEETASYLARKIRNMMLEKSDKYFAFDRLDFDFSSPEAFMKSFEAVCNSPEAIRRQSLRDLPVQYGFPFEVEFPVDPNEENQNEVGKYNL